MNSPFRENIVHIIGKLAIYLCVKIEYNQFVEFYQNNIRSVFQ